MFTARDRGRLEGELQAARVRIEELEAELGRVTRDLISTELLTLRSFLLQLSLEVQRAERYSRPLAVAVIDIDGFSKFNLRNGYRVGDVLLRAVGGAIVAGTRANDLVCRVGGDEFA